MFKFITRQPFWVNLIAAILLIFFLVFLFLQSLSWFTHHGSYLQVPPVVGEKTDNALKFLEDKGFDVVITDSLYEDTLPLGVVKRQLPAAGATVKVNRTVYLNVNPSVLPVIEMPKLEGLSFRYALDLLNKNHLKLGDTTGKTDFTKNTVLEQLYNGSKVVPGTKLKWGSSIDLVISTGLSQEQIPVPQLYGLTLGDAKTELERDGIILAAVLPSGSIQDTLRAYVYKQNPDVRTDEGETNYMQRGQTMDVWISATPPESDSTQLNIPRQDSSNNNQ
ncbi:MAG TPA: PASTA domain-containing protein [Chitinophagaceae bacterium]|nr:PASTA domain-containing protein [Chitinophagaceae bacterium]